MSATNRAKAIEICRSWNLEHPIGSKVIYNGVPRKTWSHAGLGAQNEPSVFLVGEPDEPVSLASLESPETKPRKKREPK